MFGAVEQLKCSGDKFNLANTAWAQLHVSARRRNIGAVNLLFDPRLEIADFDQHVGGHRAREYERLQTLAEFIRNLHVAGDAAGLDQREAFPSLAVTRVVVFSIIQRGDERTVLALGPQAEIHPEERSGRLICGERANEFFPESREVFVVRKISAKGSVLTKKKHQIDVG